MAPRSTSVLAFALVTLIAAGLTDARSTADTTTEAYLGSGVQLTGGSLRIGAFGQDQNYAETKAGAGGLISGASATVLTRPAPVRKPAVAKAPALRNSRLRMFTCPSQ